MVSGGEGKADAEAQGDAEPQGIFVFGRNKKIINNSQKNGSTAFEEADADGSTALEEADAEAHLSPRSFLARSR